MQSSHLSNLYACLDWESNSSSNMKFNAFWNSILTGIIYIFEWILFYQRTGAHTPHIVHMRNTVFRWANIFDEIQRMGAEWWLYSFVYWCQHCVVCLKLIVILSICVVARSFTHDCIYIYIHMQNLPLLYLCKRYNDPPTLCRLDDLRTSKVQGNRICVCQHWTRHDTKH